MAINKYKPHVYLICEDEANQEIAQGFRLRTEFNGNFHIHTEPAGGWEYVGAVVKKEYLVDLEKYPHCHVVLLIDFDEKDPTDRIQKCLSEVPAEFHSRIYVIGTRDEPETYRNESGKSLETIGNELAEGCATNNFEPWQNEHVVHNQPELKRLVESVRSILFTT